MALLDQFRGPATSLDDQIESFSTERVPGRARWPIPAISLVLLGNATAMFFFSFGAQQTFLVGWPMMLLPIGYFFVGAVLIGMLAMRMAAREGLSQNLLSRGLGFGSRGAAVTSFIYAVNYVYYFLFEGTIVTHAIAIYFNVSINSIGGTAIFAAVGLGTLGFVWRGMHAMSKLQSWGFPIFLVLLAWGLIQLVTHHDPAGTSGWNATAPLTVAAVMNALSFANGQMIFQGLLATDYGMELLRLGLERGHTAAEAVAVITGLVERHGQYGAGTVSTDRPGAAYDNSFIVADPTEAWVVETTGRRCVTRRVREPYWAVSNEPTLRTDWDTASADLVEYADRQGWRSGDPLDFAATVVDPGLPLQVSHLRLQRSRQLLGEAGTAAGTGPHPERAAADTPVAGSFWWSFQNLLETVAGDVDGTSYHLRQPEVRARFDQLQQRWLKQVELLGPHASDEQWRALTNVCVIEAQAAAEELTRELSGS